MLVAICLGLALIASPSLAYPSFQEQLPNGNNVDHPCKVNYRWPGLGHENPLGGGSRNPFGQDFHDMGFWWSPDLCRKDSDGDGRTNGEELGDPDCTWKVGDPVPTTVGITHPGVCEPLDSEQCKGKNDFVSCELDGFDSCDAINDPEVRTIDLKFPETKVPASETNYYCMTFDLPSDQDYHIVADEVLMDNMNVLHHIIIYGCEEADALQIDTPQPCGMSSEGECGSFISIWAVGLAGVCHPENAGFRIGKTSFKRVRMEIHYNNPMKVDTYTDSSGLRLYYQPVRDEIEDLVTVMTGQTHLEIPPGMSRVEAVGVCPSDCTTYMFNKPAYITSVFNHMHYLGRSMKIELFRNGQLIKVLSNDEYYSYDSPVKHEHDPPIMVQAGDEIKTTCVFNSLSSDRYVYYGDGTNDEMCFGFVTMYPKDALSFAYCSSYGPLSTCDLFSGAPIGECDWRKFLDPTDPESAKMYEHIFRNCNLNGFCRPECAETLEAYQKHPCLNGEAGEFVKKQMQESPEGVSFLGRLHSCPMGHTDHGEKDCKEECKDWCSSDDKDGWDHDGVYSGAPVTALASTIVTLMATLFVFFK